VKNITITNFASGIIVSRGSDIHIVDNTVTNNSGGIRVYDTCVVDISRNTVIGNTVDGVSSGIVVRYGSGVTVSENTTTDTTTGQGIRIDESPGFVVSKNNIDAGGYIALEINSDDGFIIENTIRGHIGVRMVDADSNMVIENTFENCTLCYTYPPTGELMNGVVGIEVWRSSGNTISKNIIDSDHRSGIRLHTGSNDNVITGNSISNHAEGYHTTAVNIYNSDNNTINYNTISNNGFPFIVYNSTTNKIYNNNFVSNLNAGLIWGPVTEIDRDALASNIINLELPIGGNYWDKFDDASEGCEDLNNDNICDSSFTDPTSVFVNDHTVIFELQDNLPWSVTDGWLVNSPVIPDIDSLDIPGIIHCPYTIPEPEVPVCEEPEVLDVESNTCVVPEPELTLICHIPPGNPDNPQTIQIPTNAYPAHLDHGDYEGACIEEENKKANSKSNNGKSDSKSKQK